MSYRQDQVYTAKTRLLRYLCPHCARPLGRVEQDADAQFVTPNDDWRCPTCQTTWNLTAQRERAEA